MGIGGGRGFVGAVAGHLIMGMDLSLLSFFGLVALTGVVIETENGQALRAWCGDAEYLIDPSTGYKPPPAEPLRVLAGRYDNDDRWAGPLYVYVRDGRVFLGNIVQLVPADGGGWRTTDSSSPERIHFDGVINGVPQRLLFSGIPYTRRFS